MVTFLVASILLIGLLAAIFYFWQRPSQHKLNPFASEAMPLPPTESLGLFSDSESNEAVTAQIEAAAAAAAREYLAGLIARAREMTSQLSRTQAHTPTKRLTTKF